MKRGTLAVVLAAALTACAPRVQMMDFAPMPGRSLRQDIAACRLDVEQQRTPSSYYTIPNTAVTAPYYDPSRTNELFNLCMEAKGYVAQL